MKKFNRFLLVLLMVTALLCFWGCEKPDPNLEVLEMILVATEASQLRELDNYPNLQSLDLRGSKCYDAIEEYIDAHPQVQVTYEVELCGKFYDPAVTELEFEDGSFVFEELLEGMKHLRKLERLNLPRTSLTNEQLSQLMQTYPNLDVRYTLVMDGQEMDPGVEQLDLSHMDAAKLMEVSGTLARLVNLKDIQLMDENGTSKLSMTDVKALMDAVPGVALHYSFELFGQTLSTTDEQVEFIRVDIGNEGIAQVRQALDIMPGCTYFKMDRCGADDEVMAQLRDDYPNTKIVWRVFFSRYNCLTDVEMINCSAYLADQHMGPLKYCTDVLYLDIGHNGDVSNLDFIGYMTKLRVAIVVGCTTETLEPFANCLDLEWLEIVGCKGITDLSPLANCTKMKGLNMSGVTGVKDLSPLYGMKEMERLYLGSNGLSDEQKQRIREELPDCWVTNSVAKVNGVSGNYAIGWRLDEDGERSEYYKWIREIFRYDENYSNKDD